MEDLRKAEAAVAGADEVDANKAESPDVGETMIADTLGASAGSIRAAIAGYEILKEIHRGGQGVVYQAIQQSTKRKVAIKILLEGPFASPAARQRFEREIELVAQLKHPNIITIFHSGLLPDGRQYCVMDYVRGTRLDEHVREKKLPLEEALRLFAKVCEAVNYAHQRGVIHRDLKPANVLVDSEGEPRVLDFGLAKQMAGAESSPVSITGQVVGTLPYMSPEQARGNPDEIDIRTDVYALGVILYEMLTGHYPYPVIGQMADVMKHIAQTEPTPPSRSWKCDSGITQRTGRKLRPGQCPIDDEVQTIVLRSLAKERERRYQSAGDLSRDVGHYLEGEPIEAKRDSTGYVLRKQISRHRRPLLAFAAVLAIAFVGLAVSLSLWSRAASDRERALNAERQKAMDDALLAAATGSFVAAEKAIERAELVGVPMGWIRALQAQVSLHSGDPDKALRHLEQAVRLMPENVAAKAMLPIAYQQTGQLERATIATRELDISHPVTAEDYLFKGQAELVDGAPQALATLDEAIRRRDSALARMIRANARYSRAIDTGKPSDVEAALQDVLVAKAMLPDNPVVRMTDLYCQVVAANIYGEHGDGSRRAAALAAAQEDVVALAPFASLARSHRPQALYFELFGDNEKSLAEWRAGAVSSPAYDLNLCIEVYAQRGAEEALAMLDRSDTSQHDAIYHTLRGYFVCELENGAARALEEFEYGMVAASVGHVPLYPATILQLLGRPHDAVAACKRIDDRYLNYVSPWWVEWFRKLLDYNRGNSNADAILRAAGDSRYNQCEANFYIGMNRLGNGDRPAANRHFQAACDTNAWPYAEYRLSRAMLMRLRRDPAWPPWIPMQSSTRKGSD